MVTQADTQRARCFDPQEVHAQLGFVSAEGGSEASARSDLARKAYGLRFGELRFEQLSTGNWAQFVWA